MTRNAPDHRGPSNSQRAIAGVLPVIQMPYHDDESIDYDTLGREADWLCGHGVDGLVIAMVSEVLRLSERERLDVARFLVAQAGQRVTITTSIGAESAHHACELARQAGDVGVDAVMAVPPIAIAADDDEIRRYYERIAAAVELPVIVQDASGYVGRPMSIVMQARLLADLGERVHFKPEAPPLGPRLTALLDATNGRARVFEGSGGAGLVESHRRGIVGTMPGADLIAAILALWRALEANDETRVNRVAPPLAALIAMQSSLDAFLAIEKHLLHKQGVFRNTVVRGPRGYQLDEITRAEVDRLFSILCDAIAG